MSSARTPLGSFRGSLKEVSAVQLGSVAIKGAVERAGIPVDAVEEVFFGNVMQAGSGCNIARQCAVNAGLKTSTIGTTVNKVCASGMKAIMLGSSLIRAGDADVVVAGGVESMSNVPYYMTRGETPYGGVTLVDGIISDGLTDPFNKIHMGDCAENTAAKLQITRQQQDDYAISSYKKAAAAAEAGILAKEIVPVTIPGKRGQPDRVVSEDEEYKKIDFAKLPKLNPAFKKDGTGTITAANASTLNDGAAAVVLASESAVAKYGLKPLAKVIDYADAAHESIDFPTAPALAVKKVRKKMRKRDEEETKEEEKEGCSFMNLILGS